MYLVHAHCKDFGSISTKDTPEMKASKERIAELVREWVGIENDNELSTTNVTDKLGFFHEKIRLAKIK